MLFLALVPFLLLSANAADTPKRGGGLFGFGVPPSDQISAGLFPESGTGSGVFSSSATRSGEPNKSADGIFRSGQPQKVEAVSYVIENGRRVERPTVASPVAPPLASPNESKPVTTPALQPLSAPVAAPVLTATEAGKEKKRGFLGFGKKAGPDNENPVVTPVPSAGPLLAATPVTSSPPAPKPASPAPIATPEVKPVAAKPVEMANDVPVADSRKADTPEFTGIKPEKSGWLPSLPAIPFLNRNKKAEAAPGSAEAPVLAAKPVDSLPANAGMSTSPEATPQPTDTPVTKPVESAPATVANTSTPPSETPTYEIRRDPNKSTESKKESDAGQQGGLLTPIAKIRPPRKEKEIDLTGAETIIADGEIVVKDSPSMLASAPEGSTSGPRQAPQVVNGVKTYSSWDDVNASSSSAADKIISRIR